MIKVITAVEEDSAPLHYVKLFLAGGITNCPDWQKEMIEKLRNLSEVAIYNPRRDDFPIDDPNASKEQITWEYKFLKKADIIVFWFAKGSLNPIVLYELGRWGTSGNKPIFIGCDPEYQRTQDVTIQTELSRPGVKIFDNLDDLAKEVKKYLKS